MQLYLLGQTTSYEGGSLCLSPKELLGKSRTNMKTLLRARNYLLLIPVLLACGLLTSCDKQASTEAPVTSDRLAGRVVMHPILHPAVKLSPEDEKALTEQLAKFDKSLYRIVALTNGKIDETRSMGTMEISSALKAEMANAQSRGLSAFGPEFAPCQMVAAAPSARADEERRLIEAVTPILLKYQMPDGGH